MATMCVRDPDTGKFIPASGGVNINDATPNATTTYSSSKIDALLNEQKKANEAQDEAIAKKLNASELPTAINTALEQAKESGQFDGAPGDDYILTEVDKHEIAEMAAEMVEAPGGVSGSDIHIGSEPPTDDSIDVWINPDESGGSTGGSGAGIDDNHVSAMTTYSSQKIDAELRAFDEKIDTANMDALTALLYGDESANF